jgi:hypothetical protein
MRFASVFDEAAFHEGPAAIFTPDPRGNLRVDPERSREMWLVVPPPHAREPVVYLLTDAVTGVRMLLATNAPGLVHAQPRGTVERLPDYDTALARLRSQWPVPVSAAASHATAGPAQPPGPASPRE